MYPLFQLLLATAALSRRYGEVFNSYYANSPRSSKKECKLVLLQQLLANVLLDAGVGLLCDCISVVGKNAMFLSAPSRPPPQKNFQTNKPQHCLFTVHLLSVLSQDISLIMLSL